MFELLEFRFLCLGFWEYKQGEVTKRKTHRVLLYYMYYTDCEIYS